MKKAFKIIISIMMLILSPMVVVALFGGLYIIYEIISGIALNAAVESFWSLLLSLSPYFPYMTMMPLVIVTLVFIFNKKIRHKLKKYKIAQNNK